MMMLWMALALARPLYVQPEDDGHFRVVDHTGQNIGAWHFAHFTDDRRMVNRLRWRLYFRRTTAIGALPAGAITFVAASVALQQRRRDFGEPGVVDPTVVGLGVLAAAGLAVFTIHPTNVLLRRPDWLRVDTHYSQEEAVERIQRKVRVLVLPNGIYARF